MLLRLPRPVDGSFSGGKLCLVLKPNEVGKQLASISCVMDDVGLLFLLLDGGGRFGRLKLLLLLLLVLATGFGAKLPLIMSWVMLEVREFCLTFLFMKAISVFHTFLFGVQLFSNCFHLENNLTAVK